MDMKFYLLFVIGIFGFCGADDVDELSLCNKPPTPINPKECCLDPEIIPYGVIQKCRSLVFQHEDSNESNSNKRSKRSLSGSDSSSSEELSNEIPYSKEYESHHGHGSHHHRRHHPKHSSILENNSDESHRRHHHNHHGHRRHHHHNHHGHHRHHHHHHHHHHDDGNQFDNRKINDNSAAHQFGHEFQLMRSFSECIFNETGLVENGIVNMENVKELLAENLEGDQEFIPIITEAFNVCGEKAQQLHELHDMPMLVPVPLYQFYHSSQKKYKTLPHFINMCVRSQVFLNCPASKWRHDDKKCSMAREYMNTCPHPQYPAYSFRHYYQHKNLKPFNEAFSKPIASIESKKVGTFGYKTPFKNFPGA